MTSLKHSHHDYLKVCLFSHDRSRSLLNDKKPNNFGDHVVVPHLKTYIDIPVQAHASISQLANQGQRHSSNSPCGTSVKSERVCQVTSKRWLEACCAEQFFKQSDSPHILTCGPGIDCSRQLCLNGGMYEVQGAWTSPSMITSLAPRRCNFFPYPCSFGLQPCEERESCKQLHCSSKEGH